MRRTLTHITYQTLTSSPYSFRRPTCNVRVSEVLQDDETIRSMERQSRAALVLGRFCCYRMVAFRVGGMKEDADPQPVAILPVFE